MGFESAVSYILLFSLGLSAVVGLAVFYKDYVFRTTRSLDERQEILEQKSRSDMIIKNITYHSPVPDELKITTQQDFSKGIFELTNETKISGSLILANDSTQYHDQGNWTSMIYELGHPTDFIDLNFQALVPADTYIGFQLRTAEDASQLLGNFLGPDGTEDTLYEVSGTAINPVHDGDEVIQLKAYLNTSDTSETPEVQEITFGFEWMYGSINATVLNDGKVKLDKEILDIFVDDMRIPRDYPGLDVQVLADTEVQNPSIWDPDETLGLTFPLNLSSGQHIFRLTNEFSTSDYVVFTT